MWTLGKSNLKNLKSLEDLFLNNLAPSVDIMVGLALRIFRSSVDTPLKLRLSVDTLEDLLLRIFRLSVDTLGDLFLRIFRLSLDALGDLSLRNWWVHWENWLQRARGGLWMH